jgi:phospholipid/cholesterol/gamma-HCH transport system permease protein
VWFAICHAKRGLEVMDEQTAISLSRITADTLLVRLSGTWQIGEDLPQAEALLRQIGSEPGVQRVAFDTQDLKGWDSGLLTFVLKVMDQLKARDIVSEKEGLPEGVQRLLDLATAVPEKKDAGQREKRPSFLDNVGTEALRFVSSTGELIGFVGEAWVATVKLFVGKASFRPSDMALFLQQSGAEALPIVSLISLLVGLILAFVGMIQLKIFGAEVYVADLVGIAMVREMGAIMTGIIMAGRTGAAFAAQLGTMQVNEEIDALNTLGVKPMEFLVLPRMLALTLMVPLLCMYAGFMGILGGWIVAVPLYGIGSTAYVNRVMEAVGLSDLFIGLFMGLVFGILVALAGCLRGMQCGRSASAVGDAATSAVVTGIVAIIVATAIITVLCDLVGI